jgi:fructokinase
LASGESLRQRWGERAENLRSTEAWELEAQYLALGVTNLIYSHAPERIILGGGVMAHAELLAMVRRRVARLLAGYGHDAIESDGYLEGLITRPSLGPIAGLHGGIELAKDLTTTGDSVEVLV